MNRVGLSQSLVLRSDKGQIEKKSTVRVSNLRARMRTRARLGGVDRLGISIMVASERR